MKRRQLNKNGNANFEFNFEKLSFQKVVRNLHLKYVLSSNRTRRGIQKLGTFFYFGSKDTSERRL